MELTTTRLQMPKAEYSERYDKLSEKKLSVFN